MTKRLTKSNTNIVFSGSLAGIAEYFNIDATIVRIIYVFITLMGVGSPIFLYILMAVLIPSDHNTPRDDYGHNNKYYRNNQYGKKEKPRKEAEKVDEDDWSDF